MQRRHFVVLGQSREDGSQAVHRAQGQLVLLATCPAADLEHPAVQRLALLVLFVLLRKVISPAEREHRRERRLVLRPKALLAEGEGPGGMPLGLFVLAQLL